MSYKAEIQIGVVGIAELGTLNKLLKQSSLAIDALNAKQVKAGFDVQNINAYNTALEKAWRNINKASMGTQEELDAVRDLVKAKNDQIAAQTRLNTLIEKESLLQKKIVPTANAGFGPQGPALPPGRGGGGGGGGAPRPGSLAFNPKATAENIALGAGFPLLFGGGAGQVAGGLAGSFFGGGFGGQILGSAIGQLLEDAQSRITEIGNALNMLDMEQLRKSVIYVNSELETTVRRLIEVGDAQQAQAIAAQEVANQTGMVPAAVENISKNVNILGNTWNKFTGAVSGLLSLLGAGFVTALTTILSGFTKILQYANLLGSSIRAWGLSLLEGLINRFPILQGLLDRVLNGVNAVTEEEQRRAAALQLVIDKQAIEISNNAENLALEKQRTLGRTAAEKLINVEVDKGLALRKIDQEYAQQIRDFRIEHVGVEQTIVEKGIQNIEALKQQAIEQINIKTLLQEQALEIEANTERYTRAATVIQQQVAALERANSIKQSALQAEAALNALYGAQLERQYELATTAEERYNIAIALFNQQVSAAKIEYRQTLASNAILVQKAELQASLVQLKYREVAAEKEIAIAQAVARGNTAAQIASIATSYDKALSVQKDAVQGAYEQVTAVKAVANNQNVVADAVYRTKVLQAQGALEQKLTSEQIGLSKQQAVYLSNNLAAAATETIKARNNTNALVGSIKVGTQQTDIFAKSMSNVAAAAASAANNIQRAFNAQVALNNAKKASAPSAAPQQAAKGAFWQGGFQAFAKGGVVNRPTLGLIGEGGESEYIVPESKAAGFATSYLFGKRGEDAIPSEGSGTGASPLTINVTTGPVMEFDGQRYVTVTDMERAMRMTAEGVIGRLRTPSARIALGMA